ncbi:MAG TPA: hypothetical protein VGG46_02975 [Terriglobales bacterium]|jgi:hypothetical protein
MFELARFYLPSLLLTILLSVCLSTLFVVLKWYQGSFSCRKAIGALSIPLPFICWVIYFVFSVHFTKTLVLLNSESAGIAEETYNTSFKEEVKTVNRAMGLVFDKGEAPNVRFYASCLIADMMANSNGAEVTQILQKVEDAPIIEPEFIGGNSLTAEFFTPAQALSPLTVRDVIETRLRNIRQRERS